MFRIILKLLWENVYQVSFTCALYDVEEFFTDYHWLSLFQVLLQGLVTSATRLCRTCHNSTSGHVFPYGDAS